MRYFLYLLVLTLFSCNKEKTSDEITIRGEAFGTTYAVKYYGNVDDAPIIQKSIDSVVTVVNQSMSTYIEDSDISKINRGDSTIVVDEMFRDVFTLSRKLYQTTSHYFDPTVGTLRNAYGFGDTKPLAEIDSTRLDSMMQYVGFDKVELKADGTISKQYPEIYFDFNAVAKGYGIDRIAIYLEAKNKADYLIELGGEIRARGKNQTSGKPWSVGVESIDSKLTDRSSSILVGLSDVSMASSGNYRKNRVDELTGKEYVHTINPLTGSAEKSDVLSATVIAKDCATADAYATAFMAMGLERSKSLLAALDGIEAYLVFAGEGNTKGTYATAGFEKLIVD
ncbi:FAD:protein FMN transferase [Dokdonia sinensis]|uniref:FAD:protein FMN transferase n=1 Tax=Dokdonia sinensis TaxID=2479847 RepID=A0A3M0GGA0_9FLAO|nr:FAD:protein FMN transferase [Dokdonia sinensis]RMB56346.1 FAD:protein FMN transferase [Dokdonia sinensis]